MSIITFNQFVPYNLIAKGAVIATATGTGVNTIVFPDLIGVAQSRIKQVVVGNVTFRMSGTNPEITNFDTTTGTFTCVDIVDVDIPCVAYYEAI